MYFGELNNIDFNLISVYDIVSIKAEILFFKFENFFKFFLYSSEWPLVLIDF